MSDVPEITIIPTGKRALKPTPEDEREEAIPVVEIQQDWIGYSWYIARTRYMQTPPGKKPEDVLAAEALARLGIAAWYGTDMKRVSEGFNGTTAQRNVEVEKVERSKKRFGSRKLLFSGYLFVASDGHPRRFAKMLECPHIDSLMGSQLDGAFVPVRVPGYVMQALFVGEDRRAEDEARRVVIENFEENPLEIGESVRVVDSPLAGFPTIVKKIISAKRIEIVLKILGSERLVEISVDKLSRL